GQAAPDGRHRAEVAERLLHRQVQHFADVPAPVTDFQCFTVVALAPADIAVHIHIRQEMHLDLHYPVALAGLATPAFDVERKAPRVVPPRTGLRHTGKQFAYGREHAGIGGRIASWRAADGALIYGND